MSFFLADVRDGLGPFLGIFLTERHWRPDEIGLVMTCGGIAGLLATLPAGIAADATRYKKMIVLLGCLVITVGYAASVVQQSDLDGDGLANCGGNCGGVYRPDRSWYHLRTHGSARLQPSDGTQ